MSPLLWDSLESLVALWFGLCLGSFINVVIYRLPREESVVSPRSRCPHCGALIAFYDNVPVFSWLLLRGRCRSCRKGISARYPAIEAVVGILSVAIWNRWGGEPFWAMTAVLAAGGLVAVTMIDWDTFIIPDELSLGLLTLGLLVSPWNPIFASLPWGSLWYGRLLWGFGGAVTGLLFCWGTAVAGEMFFKKEAMGGGDIKLMAAIGAWTGALGAFDCMIVASFLGSIYGLTMMARGVLKKSDPIPFGPFLSAAGIFNFFYLLPLGFPIIR